VAICLEVGLILMTKAEKVVCDGSYGEPMGSHVVQEHNDGMESTVRTWYGHCPYCSCVVRVTDMGIMEQHFESN